MKKYQTFSAENFQFSKLKKSLFIAWESFRNVVKDADRSITYTTTITYQTIVLVLIISLGNSVLCRTTDAVAYCALREVNVK